MEEGTKGLDASYKKQQARIKKEEPRTENRETRNKKDETRSKKQNKKQNKKKTEATHKYPHTSTPPHNDNRQTIANAKYLKYPSRYDKRQPTTTAATSATDRDTANHKLQTRYYALQVARNRRISITNDTPVTKPQNNRTEKYRNHDTTETTQTTQRQQTSKRQKLQEERIQAHATHKKMTGIQT